MQVAREKMRENSIESQMRINNIVYDDLLIDRTTLEVVLILIEKDILINDK